MISLMGGELSVDSKLGQGIAWRVILPLTDASMAVGFERKESGSTVPNALSGLNREQSGRAQEVQPLRDSQGARGAQQADSYQENRQQAEVTGSSDDRATANQATSGALKASEASPEQADKHAVARQEYQPRPVTEKILPRRYDILLVDDNQANRAVLTSVLSSVGHDVAVASNGLEAVSACRVKRYDLVIMDLAMPEMDGLGLVLKVRASEIPEIAKLNAVALTAFIGGLSATSSMIIVATLALGIMIANNLITPLWLKIRLTKRSVGSMQASGILTIRRLTVLVVLSVAFWYHLNISQSAPLVKSGIVAIALLAQMLPTMLFGLYWSRSTVLAASIAMLTGLSCWIVWLLYPSLLASYYFDPAPSDAELGLGFVLSLLVNCTTFVLVSLLSAPTPATAESTPSAPLVPQLAIRISDLMQLTARVLETHEQNRLLAQLSGQPTQGFASAALLQNVEHMLAGQVGPPSARVLLSAIAQTRHTEMPELVDWVEEASQTFQFNHEVLQSSVQHIQQGISVLDSHLSLLAWNDSYIDLFDYPAHFLHTGMPITSLLHYNARRGLFGNSLDAEADIAKRVAYMKAGTPYKYLRKQPDGRTIELNGSPLPGGGYVTTYSDITEYTRIQEALEQAKGGREHILEEMNKALKNSRKEFSKHTPKMETIKVDKKDIATVIGKGGATIREIVEKSGAKVDVKDTGEVTVAAPDEKSRNSAIEIIKSLIAKPEVGKIYKGKVVKIMEFGAFVNFLGKQDGLVHISELAGKRVAKVTDVVKEGDEVSVKVLGFDRGKVKLSIKQAVA